MTVLVVSYDALRIIFKKQNEAETLLFQPHLIQTNETPLKLFKILSL